MNKDMNNNKDEKDNEEINSSLNNDSANIDDINNREEIKSDNTYSIDEDAKLEEIDSEIPQDEIIEDLSHTVIQDAEFKAVPGIQAPQYHSYSSNSNYDDEDNEGDKKKKKRTKGNKPIAAYIAIALVCAIVGGGIGTIGTYKAMQSKINQVIDEVKLSGANGSSNNHISNLSSITIPEIVDQVSSAVVGVATTSVATNVFGFNMGEQQGIGSGVIFSEDGYVLTNYHVVENANQVKVIFSTGKEVSAKVVNYDQDADLAVVKITEDVELPGIAELGNSDNLKVGEDVIAIGNPLGKEYLGSVTNGIISAVNRDVDLNENGQKTNLIQTNAAINPGNSGGPLINASGQVVGINTAKIQATGVEGIGFAIPINDAIAKLDMLVKQKITLGISVINLTDELAKQYSLPVGIYVRNVDDFSIAQKGGIQPGDVITKFNGKEVKTVEELNEIKNGFSDGDTMSIEFVRKGQTMSANLVAE